MPAVKLQHFTSTIELLDAIKAQRGFTSDYQLAKHMGWTTSRLGNYRSGRSVPNDETAAAIATELNRSATYVLAVMRAESEQNAQLKELWLTPRAVDAHRVRGWSDRACSDDGALAGARVDVGRERGVCILCYLPPRSPESSPRPLARLAGAATVTPSLASPYVLQWPLWCASTPSP
jgi:transcriptional regulator with XRE-family HTH domain